MTTSPRLLGRALSLDAGIGPAAEPLLTAVDVGRQLQLPTKRVYEVVGHLAVQIAPRTLRWRGADILAFIEGRRRSK